MCRRVSCCVQLGPCEALLYLSNATTSKAMCEESPRHSRLSGMNHTAFGSALHLVGKMRAHPLELYRSSPKDSVRACVCACGALLPIILVVADRDSEVMV